MSDQLTRLLINILDYPDKLQCALYRFRFRRESWWDRVRLKIAKQIWEDWEDMG